MFEHISSLWPWTKVKVNRFRKIEMASTKDHSWQVRLKLVKQFQKRSRLKVLPYMVTVTLNDGQGQPFSQTWKGFTQGSFLPS